MDKLRAPVRVALVTNHLIFIHALSQVVSRCDVYGMVGVARSVSSIRPLIIQYQPEIILLDMELLGGRNREMVMMIRENRRKAVIIGLAMDESGLFRKVAAKLGVDGFVSKTNVGLELIPMMNSFLCQFM